MTEATVRGAALSAATWRGGRGRAGLSLVEVLVAMVILAVGMLAVVRLFLPGMTLLPGQGDRRAALNLSSDFLETLEDEAALRPYAVCQALPVDATDPTLGYVLVHDVMVGDAYQYSAGVSTLAGSRQTTPPNLVVGERFRVAGNAAFASHVCRLGPVVPGSGWVYYPTPVPMVGNVADPRYAEVPIRYQPVSWDAGTLQFVGAGIDGYRACYTYLAGAALLDVIGEPVVPDAGGAATLANTNVVADSLTIYREVGGAVSDWFGVYDPTSNPGSANFSMGVVHIAGGDIAPGETLAVTYAVLPHYRTGLDFTIVDPRAPGEPITNAYVQDIMTADAQIPALPGPLDPDEDLAGATTLVKKAKLPISFLRDEALAGDGTFNQLPWPVVAVDLRLGVLLHPPLYDATGAVTEPGVGIVSVDYHTGEVNFEDDVVAEILGAAGGAPGILNAESEWPVRIYFRGDAGWAREVHLAPESFAVLEADAAYASGYRVAPASAPTGPKQFWCSIPGAASVLTFFGLTAGAGQPDDGGLQVLVDYVYDAVLDGNDDPADTVQLVSVIGEPHIISPDDQTVTLAHPFDLPDPSGEQGVRAIRGVTMKVRTCFEEDLERHVADVDTYLAVQ
jgi:prepilin-type N-terminal cleavage/methylation domain-containing protein